MVKGMGERGGGSSPCKNKILQQCNAMSITKMSSKL